MPGTKPKLYTLTSADGEPYRTTVPGTLGGNRNLRIYGRLDCGSAIAALPKGFAQHRVFFANEDDAIAAGYRPCGNCLRQRYCEWKQGGEPDSKAYPWKVTP